MAVSFLLVPSVAVIMLAMLSGMVVLVSILRSRMIMRVFMLMFVGMSVLMLVPMFVLVASFHFVLLEKKLHCG